MKVTESDILNASILLVDDQEDNIALLRQLLGDAGYTHVDSTTNPQEVCALHRRNRYDLILLTAVWMHLDAQERSTAMQALAELLADGGQIVMSLRHGPVPEGRRMFDVSAEETITLAAAQGLNVCHHSEREDMLDRRDVRWSFLGFRWTGGGVEG